MVVMLVSSAPQTQPIPATYALTNIIFQKDLACLVVLDARPVLKRQLGVLHAMMDIILMDCGTIVTNAALHAIHVLINYQTVPPANWEITSQTIVVIVAQLDAQTARAKPVLTALLLTISPIAVSVCPVLKTAITAVIA